jgi:four helix bundle protein
LLLAGDMGVRSVEDLVAFQVAVEFKREVYAILERHPEINWDIRFKGQLADAAGCLESDLDEGFARNRPAEFAQFIRYGLASLAEARRRLRDGVDRKYFTQQECEAALRLGVRCYDLCKSLHRSLRPFMPPPRDRGRRRL